MWMVSNLLLFINIIHNNTYGNDFKLEVFIFRSLKSYSTIDLESNNDACTSA